MTDIQESLNFEGIEEEAETTQVLTVTDLNRSIRGLLESQFSLVWVRGEISNFKAHTSGHYYFSLKDDKAQISAVMFRGSTSGIKFKIEDGVEVIVRARVTVYEPRGNYQIVCEMMEPVGLGALQLAYEQLKAKLEKEGLFAQDKKRKLPDFPKKIAIVTSPTGAAIRDMLNVLGRRYRGAEVTLIPASVQGNKAVQEIVSAIQLANKLGYFDVMIVGRGGGSIEDLWSFNEEAVVRAIAASKIPTISAVGHEIDFTLSDFAADLRAPTPSAAAELVVKNAGDLNERLKVIYQRIKTIFEAKFRQKKDKALQVSKRLIDPKRKLQDMSLRCDELVQRLQTSVKNRLQKRQMNLTPLELRLHKSADRRLEIKRSRVVQLGSMLDSMSPIRVVDRGYSMVTKNKKLVRSVEQLSVGDVVNLRLAKGQAQAKIEKLEINDKN